MRASIRDSERGLFFQVVGLRCTTEGLGKRIHGMEANCRDVLRFIRSPRSGESMRGLALGESVSMALKSLKHSDSEVRRSAAATLEGFGEGAKTAIPVLAQSLADPEESVQVAATRALGGIGLAAVAALTQALSHPNKHVRREAIWALGRMGQRGEDALPALTGALRDSDLRVRLGAAQAIGVLGPKAQEAIPSLIEALKDTNLVFCRLAAQALTRIGTASLPALEEAVQSSDAFVRREASWALKQLTSSTPEFSAELSEENSDLAGWTPETPILKDDSNPKSTVAISLHPKSVQQTMRIPLA
jgi:HEAT repeat protein